MHGSVVSPPSHYENTERIVGPGELFERNFPKFSPKERQKVAETILDQITVAEREGRYLSRRSDKLRNLAIQGIGSFSTHSDSEISHKVVNIVLEFFARHGFLVDDCKEGYQAKHPDRDLNMGSHVIPALDPRPYFKLRT